MKAGQVYALMYKDEDQQWTGFYASITKIELDQITFIMSEVVCGDNAAYLQMMVNNDIPQTWSFKEFDAAGPEEISVKILKEHGRCPKCGLKGEQFKMALLCRRHHFIAGC